MRGDLLFERLPNPFSGFDGMRGGDTGLIAKFTRDARQPRFLPRPQPFRGARAAEGMRDEFLRAAHDGTPGCRGGIERDLTGAREVVGGLLFRRQA
jgi:hypothetical protein